MAIQIARLMAHSFDKPGFRRDTRIGRITIDRESSPHLVIVNGPPEGGRCARSA
jgi:hypothetical protein